MMQSGASTESGSGDWLPAWLMREPASKVLVWITSLAFLIRVSAILTKFCMAADSPSYIAMARMLAAGRWLDALYRNFSPLYPWTMAQMHRVVSDWELGGQLISLLMGTLTAPLVYVLMRRVYHRYDLAIGAAALAAIHPQLVEYSTDVLTEASYISLTIVVIWLAVRAMDERDARSALIAGLIGGVAYLCRVEAIGVLVVVAAFLPFAALRWREFGVGWAIKVSLMFAAGFLLIASPYLLYLHFATGHWTIGREFNTTWMWGADPAWKTHRGTWKVGSPMDDVAHVARQSWWSLVNFRDALEPIVALMLIVGLITRGRAILSAPAEALLAVFVAFFVGGLTLFNNDPRLMVHFVPFTFGWVMIGLESATRAIARVLPRLSLPRGALAGVVVIALVPQALWPSSYDRRGLRYAGREIARRHGRCVAATDRRVAIYADAGRLELPDDERFDLCGWLEGHPEADYVLLETDEERRIDGRGESCLSLIARYPRKHAGDHFDLFAVGDELRRRAAPRAPAALTSLPPGTQPGQAP